MGCSSVVGAFGWTGLGWRCCLDFCKVVRRVYNKILSMLSFVVNIVPTAGREQTGEYFMCFFSTSHRVLYLFQQNMKT